MMTNDKHFVCKEDLLETVLDHFGCDLAYYGKDLQYCQEAIQFAPTVNVVPVERFNELQTENDVLKRFIKGEWVDCKDVQKALEIDFTTGLIMFEFSRTVEWNKYPLHGQKITTKFRLKRAGDQP